MTSNQVSWTIQKSHICSYYFYLLEITSAIATDYEEDALSLHSRPLRSWIRYLSGRTRSEALEGFDYVLENFLKTAKWDNILLEDLVRNNARLINTAEKLHCLGLIGALPQGNGNLNDIQGNEETVPLSFGPDRDISFGHYTLVIQVIRASLIISPLTEFTFFRAPLTATAFPEFLDIVDCRSIKSVDLEKDFLSADQLKSYHLQGGSERAREYWNKRLFSCCHIQADNAFDSTFPLKRQNRRLISCVNRVIRIPLQLGNGTSSFENRSVADFIARSRKLGRKLVCFSPRDSAYSGPGQYWRDTDVNEYHMLVLWLIRQGYSVLRINPSGIPARFTSDCFLDNTTVGAPVHDQMKMIAMCEFAIGSSTGSTEYAHQLFNKPTLYIDSAVIYNTGTEADIIHASKKLLVRDSDRLKSSDIEQLGSFIFGSCWNPTEASKYGLDVSSLKPDEKLSAVSSFTPLTNKSKVIDPWDNVAHTLSLQELLGIKGKYFGMHVARCTYKNLYSVIANRLEI